MQLRIGGRFRQLPALRLMNEAQVRDVLVTQIAGRGLRPVTQIGLQCYPCTLPLAAITCAQLICTEAARFCRRVRCTVSSRNNSLQDTIRWAAQNLLASGLTCNS
jgi:hypothetical protein